MCRPSGSRHPFHKWLFLRLQAHTPVFGATSSETVQFMLRRRLGQLALLATRFLLAPLGMRAKCKASWRERSRGSGWGVGGLPGHVPPSLLQAHLACPDWEFSATQVSQATALLQVCPPPLGPKASSAQDGCIFFFATSPSACGNRLSQASGFLLSFLPHRD